MEPMFEVLGGVRAMGPEGPIELQPQVRRVLRILLADRDAPVPVERLIDRLWGAHAPARAVKVVRVALGRLRAALEPARDREPDDRLAVARNDGYVLKTDALDL